MPHPAKAQDPPSRNVLHNSVSGGPNKAMDKKGGAGGKGSYGALGSEYRNAPAHLDKGDPNYDPEEQPGAVLEASM